HPIPVLSAWQKQRHLPGWIKKKTTAASKLHVNTNEYQGGIRRLRLSPFTCLPAGFIWPA
ncbi:hypothetical protein NL529_31600, partial [Klebsiella pneumoniae]|nr:hypothetical protein [Klebsiella pneumoniae]